MGIRGRRQPLATTLVGLVIFGVAAPRTASFSSILRPAEEDLKLPSSEVPLDLYGNEVRQAVERYKVDALGEWYEEHSPDTEVPKLAPPQG